TRASPSGAGPASEQETGSVSGASRKPGALTPSTTTGSTPVPCLPVDSATSCSIQSPSPTGVGAASAALSRPAAPSAAPSSRAGLSLPADSDSASAAASSSSAAASTPASAVGTRPNADSAL